MSKSKEMQLTDFIDIEILQRMQNAFTEMTGMAALVTDKNGKAITKESGFTDFCNKFARSSDLGRKRCEYSDRCGTELTLESDQPTCYSCHAGLIHFAAPIKVNGIHIGGLVGGQVITEAMDPQKIRQLAKDIGVEPMGFLFAANQIEIVPQAKIEKAADFLSNIAYVLSDIADGKYTMGEAIKEIERAGKMKSDFLANMSHEIRTPMNAVIGMAEMALREDLPPVARDYIQQIRSSGRELLTIINDILDFSKIESGKMDIIPVEYETMSIINDVVNIIMTRLKQKNVELILNITPDIPNRILGDNIRIKQILINIANNATKFTNEGQIILRVGYEKNAEDNIELQISVKDTGIGIKKNDLTKLFQSFQQVDSKRNRSVEGTGLGLAISKQLLTLMDGDIKVESEYGQGSTFSFHLPQQVIDSTPSIQIPDPEHKTLIGYIANEYVKEQLINDCAALHVEYVDFQDEGALLEYLTLESDRERFLIIEKEFFTNGWAEFAKNNNEITVVLLTDFFDSTKYNLSDYLVMKKPIYALNLATLLKGESIHQIFDDDDNSDFDFIAPEAEILVVDDNAVNQTIVEGLLKPLEMKIHTASSGAEAIERIGDRRFDLIFMDHMMPEMDGVETTRIIRRFHPEYNDVPILALTANAVDGTKEMFLNEGMNDFVAKPIELRTITQKLRQWIPNEKIQKVTQRAQQSNTSEKEPIFIGDLDIQSAIRLLGGEQLFWSILETYYKSIEKKAATIRELWEKEDWKAYTIEVHSLKSFSSQVGATQLSEMAADMEKAGNANDIEKIQNNTEKMLKKYLGYLPILEPIFRKEEENDDQKEDITVEQLRDCFEQLKDAIDNLDMDQVEEVITDMKHYRYEDGQKELFTRLQDAAEDFDTDACESILAEWESNL